VNLPQTLLKYWQSRTYSPPRNQERTTVARVRLHTTESSEHVHDARDARDKRICDSGKSAKHLQNRLPSLAESTTGRVNLDWIPGDLLYD